jgi:hypothetical protein
MRGEGCPTQAATVEERVGADIVLRHVHDEAAADFGDDLQGRIDASGAGTAATDTGTAAEERFVIREGGELDIGFLGMRVIEFDASGHPFIFDKLKWFLAVAIFIVGEELFANFVVIAEEIEAGVANPGRAEGHDVGEGAAGIEEAAREDDHGAIVGAILQAHDEVTIGGVFGEHGAEAKGWRVDQSDEAGRGVQHDVGDGGFAEGADFPLGVPDGGIGHGAQHADPILAAVAELDQVEARIILPFNETEDGTFDGMADVGSHEGVAIAPAAKFGYGFGVVSKPMTIERIARSGLKGEVESVHDAGVEERFAESGQPTEMHVFARLRIPRVFAGVGVGFKMEAGCRIRGLVAGIKRKREISNIKSPNLTNRAGALERAIPVLIE